MLRRENEKYLHRHIHRQSLFTKDRGEIFQVLLWHPDSRTIISSSTEQKILEDTDFLIYYKGRDFCTFIQTNLKSHFLPFFSTFLFGQTVLGSPHGD